MTANLPNLISCRPDMPLAEWLETYYLPFAGAQRSKAGRLGCARIWQLRRTIEYLAVYLHRPPMVSDLQPAIIAPFVAWLETGRTAATAKFHRHNLESLCRVAGTLSYVGMRGRTRRVLSEEPGTLWRICLQRYFPARLSIRSDKTRHQYRIAMADFRDFLGHEPTVADLTHENLVGLMKLLVSKGASPAGANEKRGRIVALWNWLAKKREVPEFPMVEKLPVPRRIPRAWTEDELCRLFASCRQEQGEIVPGVPAADFWLGLHGVLWDTGERIGAVLACDWAWLSFDGATLEIPAEVRKGKAADRLYPLHANTLTTLARMKPAGYPKLFPWPFCENTLYTRYSAVLQRAGLPSGRKDKFHKMRRSVASHLQAKGHDACSALDHSTPEVTRKSYLDPRVVSGGAAPCNVLPRPDAEPRRLEYREPPDDVSPDKQ